MKWIKLHLEHDGREAYFNADNIGYIEKQFIWKSYKAVINFIGEGGNQILVKETLEEIMEKIEK